MKIIALVLLLLTIICVAALPIGLESQNIKQQSIPVQNAPIPNATIQNVNRLPTVQQPSISQAQSTRAEGNGLQESSSNQAFYFEPQNLTVKNGDVFNVTVMTDVPSNQEMVASEFHLSWNTSILNGLSIIKVLFQNNSIGWDQLHSVQNGSREPKRWQ